MSKATGYALRLAPNRLDILDERLEAEMSFAEPVPEFDHSRSAALICFITTGGNIVTHLARAKKGTAAGTYMRRLNLSDVTVLDTPIRITDVLKRLPKRYASLAEKRFESGGLFPPKTFQEVVDAVNSLDRNLKRILDRFSSDYERRTQRLSSKVKESLALQKEALQTALTIASIDRYSLQDWTMPEDGIPDSFLDGLPTARLREDPIVIHDLLNFPGYRIIKSLPYNAAVFLSNSSRLTVIMANRQPLENQTGTDLIYYNETFECFVMVQYKVMDHDSKGAYFRIPNVKLDIEVERMNALLAELGDCEVDGSLNGYRLNENPFFIKLCSKLIFNPDDVGLIPGMYLPLGYWAVLSNSPALKGPRGGLRITYDNVGRYFDNTSFASLVSQAWVGSNSSQSSILRHAIRGTLEAGKAVALAIESDRRDNSTRDQEVLF